MMRREQSVLATIRLLCVAALVTIANGCQSKPAEPKQKSDKATSTTVSKDPIEILNVSYDPTREFYKEFNPAFAQHWAEKTGQQVKVKVSHGGSGNQARDVIAGMAGRRGYLGLGLRRRRHSPKKAGADPRRLAEATAAQQRPVYVDDRFPGAQGEPQAIKDWDDLIKPERVDHHAESEDLGRGAVELSGGLGIRAETRVGRPGQVEGPEQPPRRLPRRKRRPASSSGSFSPT